MGKRTSYKQKLQFKNELIQDKDKRKTFMSVNRDYKKALRDEGYPGMFIVRKGKNKKAAIRKQWSAMRGVLKKLKSRFEKFQDIMTDIATDIEDYHLSVKYPNGGSKKKLSNRIFHEVHTDSTLADSLPEVMVANFTYKQLNSFYQKPLNFMENNFWKVFKISKTSDATKRDVTKDISSSSDNQIYKDIFGQIDEDKQQYGIYPANLQDLDTEKSAKSTISQVYDKIYEIQEMDFPSWEY